MSYLIQVALRVPVVQVVCTQSAEMGLDSIYLLVVVLSVRRPCLVEAHLETAVLHCMEIIPSIHLVEVCHCMSSDRLTPTVRPGALPM